MRQFGLIGYPLGHSFSKKYFSEKFIQEEITDAGYENYPIASISEFPNVLQTPGLQGLNVTIPYKEQVIPYLDELSPVVQNIGACNCIKIHQGKSIGYNTDVVGFQHSFQPLLKAHHTHALVLGTGGAAKAVQYVLTKLGIEYKLVSRKSISEGFAYADLNEDILTKYTVIINTTPLGTFPNTEEAPAIPYDYITQQHYLYDLVYNPPLTKFLSMGKENGAMIKNGSDMLILQAEESWRIWNTDNP